MLYVEFSQVYTYLAGFAAFLKIVISMKYCNSSSASKHTIIGRSVYLVSLLCLSTASYSPCLNLVFPLFILKKCFFPSKTIISQSYYVIATWIYLVNFSLLSLSVPNISNPGPSPSSKDITVFYQNIRGFIPFSSLGKNNPSFDVTNY